MNRLFVLLILSMSFIARPEVAAGAELIVPDPHTDAAFLHGEFKPGRAAVVVFKDPFCPYCIRAIPGLERLSYYNVYLFWSPILGARSEERVQEILRCPSVASGTVLAAVEQRAAPACSGPLRPDVLARNAEVVASYGINAVPSYFLGGQRTSLSALARASDGLVRTVNGVAVDWSRYQLMRREGTATPRTQAVILINQNRKTVSRAIEELAPQFLFVTGGAETAWVDAHCHGAGDAPCPSDYEQRYGRGVAEFLMLLGLEDETDAAYVIGRDGALSAYGYRVAD